MDRPPPPRRSPVITVVPLLLVVGLYVGTARKAAEAVGNTDTYFHLRLGEEFLSGWRPWDPGQISTFAHADWLPTQWLSQVALAAIERGLGLPGVAWLTGVMLLAYALTIFLVARSFAPLAVAAFIGPVIAFTSFPYLSGRPQVMSYLFVAVTVWAWLRVRRTAWVPWFLVPLTWLWAMVHGMWPVGIVTSAVAVVGLWLDHRADPTTTPRLRWSRAAAVPLASVLVAGLTPVGPGLYRAVTHVGGISKYFNEWQPVSIRNPLMATAAVLIALTLVIAVRRGRMQWLDLLLLLTALGWLTYADRTVPVASAIIAPLLAVQLGAVVPDRGAPTRLERGVVLGGFVAAVAVLAAVVPFTSDRPMPQDPRVLERIDALPSGTPVLNDWSNGGFDIWRWPDLDFVMHGYGDVFTEDEIERNAEIDDSDPGWVRLVRETGARIALVPEDGQMAYQLRLVGWEQEIAVDDGDTTVLVAPEDW